jgi:hypothetical protein
MADWRVALPSEIMRTNVKIDELETPSRRQVTERARRRWRTGAAKEALWIVIPYTTDELTRMALDQMILCAALNVHVALVDVQVVPSRCSMSEPPVDKEFALRRVRDLLKRTRLPGIANVVYSRDWMEGFLGALDPHSLVLLVARKRLWQTKEDKIARKLAEAGHQVMLFHV